MSFNENLDLDNSYDQELTELVIEVLKARETIRENRTKKITLKKIKDELISLAIVTLYVAIPASIILFSYAQENSSIFYTDHILVILLKFPLLIICSGLISLAMILSFLLTFSVMMSILVLIILIEDILMLMVAKTNYRIKFLDLFSLTFNTTFKNIASQTWEKTCDSYLDTFEAFPDEIRLWEERNLKFIAYFVLTKDLFGFLCYFARTAISNAIATRRISS